MARIAGDNPGYTFRMCRDTKAFGKVVPTKHGFDLPSVSTIITEVIGKSAGAMSWWGYRTACDAVAAAGTDVIGLDPDDTYELLKKIGPTPNTSKEEAGDRGSAAHEVLENYVIWNTKTGKTAEKAGTRYTELLDAEEKEGTQYGLAATAFVDEAILPYLGVIEGTDGPRIVEVITEQPVFSLKHQYAGTLDLALFWVMTDLEANVLEELGWEILDAKTHKPAAGFTTEGKGPGYQTDAIQCRAYRTAWEEMGLGKTFGQRTIVLRDKSYKGRRWLADEREVSEEFWFAVRSLYEERVAWEKGA
jgi:hypothetical protein